MNRVALSERLSLSAIVQGFWRLADWNLTAAELAEFMRACIARGVTSFDTAEVYANTRCETLLGDALRSDPSLRAQIELVTKTGIFKTERAGRTLVYYDTSYERVIRSCKESLRRLGVDAIDLYLIHREDPCLDVWETGRALLDLKKEGLVREIGVSNFDPHKFCALQKAVDGALVTNQIEWNPLCFEHFDSGMIDLLTAERIHPMVWSPLAGGRLFRGDDEGCARVKEKIDEIAARHGVAPATVVYAWILYHPAGAVPISGSGKLERLDCAIQALTLRLERSEWYEIYTASGQQRLR